MIHIIVGTRAQLIKMAPVMIELQKQKIDYNFIFMAEHNETIDSMISMFKIKKPDLIIGERKNDITDVKTMFFWSLKVIFSSLYNRNKIFKNDKNGIILVHGDAPPSFLGSLIGRISSLKVGHVESGLRSFNIFNPFPEEITRILTFNLVNYYFSPDDWALNNLKKYNGFKINTMGNTLLDSLRLAINYKTKSKAKIPKGKYCVATIHRFENISKKSKFEEIITNIEEISKKFKVLFILHPPTRIKLDEYNFNERLKSNKNIELRPRYDYFDFIKLLNNAEFIISDGGSNQEECYYLGKPCLLMRNETERKEGLGKNAILSKFDKAVINSFVMDYKKYKINMINSKYFPSKIIVDAIRRFK